MRNLYLLACVRVGCPGAYFVKSAKRYITFSLLDKNPSHVGAKLHGKLIFKVFTGHYIANT